MYDVHTHFIPAEVLRWIKDNKHLINASWEKRDQSNTDYLIINHKWPFALSEPFINWDLFDEKQRRFGITQSLISPLPQLFLYDFDPEITKELSAVYNQSLGHQIQNLSNHYFGLGTVPLNHPEQAAKELKAAMSLGLKGAIIGTGVAGQLLTEDAYIPFWEEANRLGAILFIHPLLSDDPRMRKGNMSTLSGVLWEMTVCGTDIILSGLLDKYPNVKILLAHGGGFLPYQVGRLNKGYEVWDNVSSKLQEPPLEYLKRFWFDSVLWNSDTVAYLIEIVGEKRVVPGSDFPFELSDWPPSHNGKQGWNALMQSKKYISV
ncbi:amidohydrolase family protein [Neobacillus niacini]|uniref:amidohydrolase family protein n=1 Tax=Neobacillus niacini TaxID=86668 RepID=UPI002FFF1557